jgi:hypothetical protein
MRTALTLSAALLLLAGCPQREQLEAPQQMNALEAAPQAARSQLTIEERKTLILELQQRGNYNLLYRARPQSADGNHSGQETLGDRDVELIFIWGGTERIRRNSSARSLRHRSQAFPIP